MAFERLGGLARSMVSRNLRARLRRAKTTNRVLSLFYGGTRSKPHPKSPFQIYFDGYRNIGWVLGDLSLAEATEMTFVRSLLERDPPKCVWDIGANVGFWSLFFSGFKPRIEQVVCFEPDSFNVRYLKMNREKNRIDQMDIQELALSNETGEARFFADDMTGATGTLESATPFITKFYGGAMRETVVRVSTVDAEIERGRLPPAFIKIDVEGHELRVLQGARETLRKHRPSLIMEVSNNQGAISTLLGEHQYQMLDPLTGQVLQSPAWATVAVPNDRLH